MERILNGHCMTTGEIFAKEVTRANPNASSEDLGNRVYDRNQIFWREEAHLTIAIASLRELFAESSGTTSMPISLAT